MCAEAQSTLEKKPGGKGKWKRGGGQRVQRQALRGGFVWGSFCLKKRGRMLAGQKEQREQEVL